MIVYLFIILEILLLFKNYSRGQAEPLGITIDELHGLKNVVYNSLNQLPFDSNNRLNEHHLLYLDLPHCEREFSNER